MMEAWEDEHRLSMHNDLEWKEAQRGHLDDCCLWDNENMDKGNGSMTNKKEKINMSKDILMDK